ncbi:MAG TPA: AmmeMemoRadiSam system protein B [Thermodesulfobacteriota bacterium]|nr:AmmeMemoRadiSam system protein B [Deltaproteobacteria bacterium]HQO77602.1 AmmeMemoRadiSam system protein B [Thermodesulfobacteriota bacterium]
MDHPKLRNVEVFPVDIEGQQLIAFRDPLRMSENIIFLPAQALPVVSMFDGKHSILDIQAAYMRSHGALLYSDQILEVASSLDENYLLESDRFFDHLAKLEREFSASPDRKAWLAGNGYEENPEALRSFLDRLFLDRQGPGSRPRRNPVPRGLRGFIAPHIDFSRGGPCYAWAYRETAEHSAADVFILLGTLHAPSKRLFIISRKNFQTPFGTLSADQNIIERLDRSLGPAYFADEFLHRSEHSIEFQTVFLSYLFSGLRKVTIVPILCGSFYELMCRRQSPSDVEEVNTFIDTLREAVAEDGRRICLVAGADLAHVGPQFGDAQRITPSSLQTVRAKDLAMLDRVIAGDAEGFYAYVEKEHDDRKICGLPPIYLLLRLLRESEGRLLNYGQWCDPSGIGAVTFASLVFYEARQGCQGIA